MHSVSSPALARFRGIADGVNAEHRDHERRARMPRVSSSGDKATFLVVALLAVDSVAAPGLGRRQVNRPDPPGRQPAMRPFSMAEAKPNLLGVHYRQSRGRCPESAAARTQAMTPQTMRGLSSHLVSDQGGPVLLPPPRACTALGPRCRYGKNCRGLRSLVRR